jgi:hypothetical protein
VRGAFAVDSAVLRAKWARFGFRASRRRCPTVPRLSRETVSQLRETVRQLFAVVRFPSLRGSYSNKRDRQLRRPYSSLNSFPVFGLMKWTLLQAAHVNASYLRSSESGSSSIQCWTLIEVLGQVMRKAGIGPYMIQVRRHFDLDQFSAWELTILPTSYAARMSIRTCERSCL